MGKDKTRRKGTTQRKEFVKLISVHANNKTKIKID